MRIGPFRFHFYSDEGDEPPHIHVRAAGTECKFRLPVALASNRGMKPHDVREVERLVFEQKATSLSSNHEFQSDG